MFMQASRSITARVYLKSSSPSTPVRALSRTVKMSASQDPREAGAKPPHESIKEQSFPGSAQELSHQIKIDYGEESYVGYARLNGKKAIVTGGDSGIGRAVCLAYAREGADVAFSYLQGAEEEDARETKRLIEAAGRKAVAVGVNFEDGPSACKKIVDAAVQHFGRVDVLVNNASLQDEAVGSIEDMSYERIQKTFKTNILPYFEMTRQALPHMSPGSSIVNTTSIQAYKPTGGILDYAATKGAMVTFTKGLGMDFVTSRGIRVNAVAPGPVLTPLVAQSFPEASLKEFGKSSSPLGRPAMPKELAPPFVFLASADASYISGEVFAVTGGVPAGA